MLTLDSKSQIESKGSLVEYVRVVVHDDGKEIHGLSSNGEPEVRPVIDCNGNPITPTVIIPVNAIGKWYLGNDAETVKAKIQANMPDIEKVKEDEKIDGATVSVVRTITDILR